MAKLKAEFLHAHYDTRTRPLGHHLVGNVHRLSPIAARFAGILNWAGRRPFLRGLMEGATGIDRRRTLPELHRDHFRRWFSRRTDVADSLRESARLGCTFPIDTDSASQSSEVTHGVCDPRRKRVVLLDDCFTTFQEPHIGRAAVAVLERMGYAVELAGVCCGRAMISKGFLTDARDVARRGIRRLAKAAADGVPVLGLEPSCVLTLADEWPELVPGPQAKAVAAAAELADAWVARQVGDSEVSLAVSPHPGKAVFHPHCHQRALVGAAGTAAALKLVPGLGVTVLDAGCCGMAGAFGYEKEHFDVSLRIANLQLAPALAAAPDAVVVATGTSCRHQIRDVTGRHAVHPMELLAGAASPS